MKTPIATPPRRSWGRIALICALVLSLFGNAVALGAWARLRDARTDLLGPEAAAARLPDDLRQDLRISLRAKLPSLRPLLQTIAEQATYTAPHAYSTGFAAVIVNGKVVVRNDVHTGARPGIPLRREGYIPRETNENHVAHHQTDVGACCQ